MIDVLVSKAVGDDGRALWESYYPLDTLEKKRADAGRIIFGLQYQNDARLAGGAVFRKSDFRFRDRAPDGLHVYQGVDLAISRKDTADYFALVTVGYDRAADEYYVLDALRDRLSFRRQAETVAECARRWNPRRIGVESVAYQAALADVLAEARLPVKKINRASDKVVRAWRLSALFEAGKIFLRPADREIADELAAFPDGGHDDLFDALETAVSLARGPGRNAFKRIKGI